MPRKKKEEKKPIEVEEAKLEEIVDDGELSGTTIDGVVLKDEVIEVVTEEPTTEEKTEEAQAPQEETVPEEPEEVIPLIGQKQFKVEAPDYIGIVQEPEVTPLLKRMLNVIPDGEKVTVSRVE